MTPPHDPNQRLALGKPLTKPILVGGSLRSAWVALPVCVTAGCLILAVVGTLRDAPPLTVFALCLAVPPAVVALVASLIQLSRRRWLEVTLDGFFLTRRDGSRQFYSDDQILAVAQRTLWNAETGGYKRRVILDMLTDEGEESIECFYVLEPNTADPLYALIDRSIRGVVERTTGGLAEGARLSGEGWHYDREGLHIHLGPHAGTHPMEELTYLAYYDEMIKIYRGEEVEPFFLVPQASRNADALGNILWGTMQARPTVNDPISTHPLGRHMYTFFCRDAQIAFWPALMFGGIGSLLLFIALLTQVVFLYVFVGICYLVLLGLMWIIWRGQRMRLDYHQFGMAQPLLGRSLRFDDIESMTWTWNHSWIYLEPRPGSSGSTIRFSSTTSLLHQLNDRNTIRDYVANQIAKRWWHQHQAGEPITWTPQLRFRPTGLEYIPSSFWGRGESEKAAYEATSYFLFPLRLDLFVEGINRPVLQQKTGVKNFYPGLFLLNQIYAAIQAGNYQTPGVGSVAPEMDDRPRDERIVRKDDV
jgi:hypothetical protein